VSPVDELPVGTVTFLFTDIEGSTRLLKQLRERYGAVLEEHQRILRQTFAAHDGREIDTQGDSFFVAFRRAKDAVAAAVEGQRRLAEQEWPDGAELRVRMGLHTGEPAAAGQRYVGLGVHRAARISAAGHGGQVIVSQATRELLRDDPLPDVSLRDLGEHQLKDLDEPERLFQLVAPGLGETFAPLKTAGPAPFEGREDELAEAAVEEIARWRRPGRKTLIAATFGAAVIGVVAGVLLTQGGGSTASAAVEPNSVGVIDPANGHISSVVSVGTTPGGIAEGAGATWVTNINGGTVSRISPGSNDPQPIQVGGGPAAVAVGGRAVWVTNGLDGTVSRIDTITRQAVGGAIHVGNGPVGIAYGAGKIWVANSVDGTVSEIVPTSGKVARTLPAIPGATGITVAFGRVWVVSPSTGTVVSLNPASGQIADQVSVGVDPVAVVAGDGAIWVANRDDGTVSKIAPKPSAHQTDLVRVGHGPVSLAAVPGSVWVANSVDGTLMRIDTSSDDVVKVVDLANPPQAVAATNDGIYAAVRSSGLEHRGGTLRVVSGFAPDFLDPALAYSEPSWWILSTTNDGLVGFRRVGGVEGVQLVPDLAVSLPTAADGGTTYAFRLRSGVRYSTGKLVQPADFRAAIERLFDAAKLPSPGSRYFAGIVGAGSCRPGHHCDLSRGIVADNATRSITFHLTAPDGDFLSKLALPFADAVPAGTPAPSQAHDHALPATGPYMVESYRKNRSVTLVRNPQFREWSVDAQPGGYPDSLAFVFNSQANSSMPDVRAVQDGKADVVPNVTTPPISRQQLAALAAQYPSQLRLAPTAATYSFFLNTRVAPFDDMRVRRAVNYAFDGRAFVSMLGPGSGTATCQILPPNYPSYKRTCPYGAGGAAGLARARSLVRSAGKFGAGVTIWTPSPAAPQGRFMVSLLNKIGLHAHLETVGEQAAVSYFARALNPRSRMQMGFNGWAADYPSVTGFLPPQFSCNSFSENPEQNSNISEFCDPAIDRLFTRAEAVQTQNPAAAPAVWQAAERSILRQAPVVPTFNQDNVAFLAKGVGNFQFHPQWRVLLDQLWLK
jgi:peptide/nickel transport system substrate-binding protein